MPPLRTCRAPAHLLLKSPFTPTSPASTFPPLPSTLLSSHLLTLQLCPAPPQAPAQPSRSLTGWTWQVDCPPFTAPAPHTDCREPRAGIGATAPARPTGRRRSGQKIGQLGWGDQPPTQAEGCCWVGLGGGAVFIYLQLQPWNNDPCGNIATVPWKDQKMVTNAMPQLTSWLIESILFAPIDCPRQMGPLDNCYRCQH